MTIAFHVAALTATGLLLTDPVSVRLLSADGTMGLNVNVSAAAAATLRIGQTVNVTLTPVPV